MPDELGQVAANATAQALIENAGRLGLTWQLRPAVVNVSASPTFSVTIDGDTASIQATSLIGTVSTNARVYVIIVPPAGVFIVGNADPIGFFSTRQTLSGTQASVILDGIPSDLCEVEVGYTAFSDNGAAVVSILMRINGNSSNVYSAQNTQGNGATTTSALVNLNSAQAFVGQIAGTGSAAGLFGSGKIWFQGWNMIGRTTFANWTYNNAIIASGGIQNVGGGTANIAPPYNSITLFPSAGNFISGSTFYVKGTYS